MTRASGRAVRRKRVLRLLLNMDTAAFPAEEPMMSAIDRELGHAFAVATIAWAGLAGVSPAQAQSQSQGAPGDASASMVQPPQPPASGVNAHNPDNMPVKRPTKPTNDPIARRPPASAAHAK
jgi:hypothetical protein